MSKEIDILIQFGVFINARDTTLNPLIKFIGLKETQEGYIITSNNFNIDSEQWNHLQKYWSEFKKLI